MGSVPDLYTTGDNDAEIEPDSYYRHYLYCDECGSFDLDSWIAPDNHEALEASRRRLRNVALLAILAMVLVARLATELFSPSLVLIPGSVLIAGLLIARSALGWKIKSVGHRCAECNATYAYGTQFFTDLNANPRNLTVADVPKPLGVSPFLRGESVEDEDLRISRSRAAPRPVRGTRRSAG